MIQEVMSDVNVCGGIHLPGPFALSLLKGFDELSPNGVRPKWGNRQGAGQATVHTA
jgi:hypothetical protein